MFPQIYSVNYKIDIPTGDIRIEEKDFAEALKSMFLVQYAPLFYVSAFKSSHSRSGSGLSLKIPAYVAPLIEASSQLIEDVLDGIIRPVKAAKSASAFIELDLQQSYVFESSGDLGVEPLGAFALKKLKEEGFFLCSIEVQDLISVEVRRSMLDYEAES